METYPIVVCGGTRGGVYLVNVEGKSTLGKVEGAHIAQVEIVRVVNSKTWEVYSSLLGLYLA